MAGWSRIRFARSRCCLRNASNAAVIAADCAARFASSSSGSVGAALRVRVIAVEYVAEAGRTDASAARIERLRLEEIPVGGCRLRA